MIQQAECLLCTHKALKYSNHTFKASEAQENNKKTSSFLARPLPSLSGSTAG